MDHRQPVTHGVVRRGGASVRPHPVRVLVLVFAGALTVGCSPGAAGSLPDGGPGSAATHGTASEAPTSTTTLALPDGTWTREITTEEVERRQLELPANFLVDNYMADGGVLLALKTKGSRWSILLQDDAGAFEVGDLGSSTYDDDARWIMTGDGTRRSLMLEWKINGPILTTSGLASPQGQPPPDDAERLILEGTWQLDE